MEVIEDQKRKSNQTRKRQLKHTWNNITGVHGILVLDEAEAVHQLDLCNLSSAMGAKVGLDIGLGDCCEGRAVSSQRIVSI